uniref:Uncharacterized protein n=1 Tax=Oryza nivara TaxID=4536 RepID=A0A0E0J3L1_ORYNI
MVGAGYTMISCGIFKIGNCKSMCDSNRQIIFFPKLVFKPHIGKEILEIPEKENLRFSQQIPSFSLAKEKEKLIKKGRGYPSTMPQEGYDARRRSRCWPGAPPD